jgi:hypothetical protein
MVPTSSYRCPNPLTRVAQKPGAGLHSRRLLLLLVFGVLTAALPGCQHDEITEYDVPREEPKVRLLGAIVPHQADVWFFKLVGPIPAVSQHKDEFEQFIRSLRFPGDGGKPVKWAVPDGWKEEAGPQPRYATLKFGPADARLELSVTKLENQGQAADVLQNVNRWRNNDLGLRAALPAEDLPGVTREDKAGEVRVTIVDATGPGTPGKSPAPMERMPDTRLPREQGARPSFKYQAPAGWETFDATDSIVPADLAFRVTEGRQKAEMTLSRAGGDLGGNVARWARQIEMRPAEVDLKKAVRPTTVDGLAGHFVDLEGPRERILGAIVDRDRSKWFFKLRGPRDLVGKQEANFRAFLDSFKFDGER